MELWMDLPWKEMMLASTFVLGAITSLVLLVSKYPATRYLGVFIIANLILAIIVGILASHAFTWPAIALMAMVMVVYTRAFFIQNTRVSLKHGIPVLLVVIISLVPYFQDHVLMIRLTATVLVIGYLLATYNVIGKETQARGISWFQNPGSRLAWFRNFTILNTLIILIWVAGYDWLFMEHVTLGIVLQLGFVYAQIVRESSFLGPIQLGNKYQKSTLTAEQKHSILGKLDDLIKKEKFYLDDTISLGSVANALHTTTHHLSQVINESKGITFQKLISQYRIEEAKKLLKNKQYEQTTIENIAAMVGYNSKSAFNTTFKKVTGLTPTDYRAQDGVRSYREERLPERKTRFFEKVFVSSNHVLSLNRTIMVSNFLKIFSRIMARNKVFSAINLFGLTVGITCCILIYLFITDERSYDRDLPNSEHIYRIAWINDNPQTRTPHPMALALANSFEDVVAATSISPWYGAGLNLQTIKVKNEEKDVLFEEPDFFFVDSTFFDVFDLELVAGDKNAPKKPWTLVITEEMAGRYFDDQDPIGKELIVDEMPLVVTAVVKGMPKNSHFHFNAFISYVSLKTINPDNPWLKWEDFGHFNYIKIAPGTDYKVLQSNIVDWVLPYLDWGQRSLDALKAGTIRFELQPITEIHLNSHLRWELENNGNILYVYILTGTLIFILLIVSINYVNLTTAKSLDRAKEVGIRKTLGAKAGYLRFQFYIESFLFCLLALLFAIGCSLLLLNGFNFLTHKSFSFTDILNWTFFIKALVGCVIISFAAGIYPALTLSAFAPSDVLKGRFSNSGQGNRLRSILVVMQFFVSAILITGSVIILKQINFMKSKELGFDQEAVISIKMHQNVEIGGIDINKLTSLQTEFNKVAGVKTTSAVSNLPGEQFDQNPMFAKADPSHRIDASEMYVDFGWDKVLNTDLAKGRNFDKSYSDDVEGKTFILNETAVKNLNLEDPIGKTIVLETSWENTEGVVVGVVKDFHFKSLHNRIDPLIIKIDPLGINHLVVKMEGQNFQQSLNGMETSYKSLEDELPFEYHFLDQQLEELYTSEIRTLNIFSIFAGIALFLACLGLLGMAIAILNQKIKEVGIRKILGASSSQIMGMVLGQFSKLISIALLLGIPVGYFLIKQWVSEFSYQVNIGILPFFIASIILFAVAVASVSVVVIRIAYSNPVDSLRSE